ncbi:MAG: DUF362 domain-containing protein [Anaerolineae bacterium]|nr:DUF362 domain-containing protein [Anaerolineae bacterium]
MNDKENPKLQCSSRALSRREFLRMASLAAAGALVSGCTRGTPSPEVPATIAVSTTAPVPDTSTAPETLAVAPQSKQVAIAHADTYEPKVVYDRVRTLLDSLGGLGGVVSSGDKVAIKINMTGGVYWDGFAGVSGTETFITHPEVVRALGQLVRDAGAKELYIVEAAYEWESFVIWNYEQVAKDLGATLVDLNNVAPYSDFTTVAVPGGKLYQEFTFHRFLEEVDVFMSVSKMKCHATCGVTHTMKNLVGLVPLQLYRAKNNDTYRSTLHGPTDETAHDRMPQIVTELNRARPVHFGLVDGIKTTEGGEGPWVQTLAPIEPHVLVAGKNAVATDAVATALMGFDPTAKKGTSPFQRCENHLNLAYDLGLGTNRLDEIEVLGESIEALRQNFTACS